MGRPGFDFFLQTWAGRIRANFFYITVPGRFGLNIHSFFYRVDPAISFAKLIVMLNIYLTESLEIYFGLITYREIFFKIYIIFKFTELKNYDLFNCLPPSLILNQNNFSNEIFIRMCHCMLLFCIPWIADIDEKGCSFCINMYDIFLKKERKILYNLG